MPTDAEIVQAMKGKGHAEIPQSGGASILLQTLQSNKGQWYSSSDFSAVFKELKINPKNLGQKLTNLAKRNDSVVVKKEGGRNFFRVN